ncbi:sugar ABC transporter ATP-binding protein [Seleniivibrio woodruffii]|uniref:Ribose transport system ATP-binding protein n=1 Tax=Seleniivibrio woodruffii TaxID=1078050 RepID=A0A4R1KBP2_9BACT|nr:sugar ABC transporter ATP-binding protein [Seleniivibrio woodruffii]TCK61988.1 ribose transport system ATP-binding protein [Seleniivibrio woodruffii]TVZ34895.1 ribose transport system ATP-binding protein [Seleniivibrio woodruffii]
MSVPVLEMKNISKSFPGVKALNDVSLRIFSGEVMALLGENGAGKSTLMKILSGVYTKDAGEIVYKGKPLSPKDPKDAMDKGIAIIHQELNLIPELTVAENIFIGREPVNLFRKVKYSEMNAAAKGYLERLGEKTSPTAKVSSLSVGQAQMVEIAKALSMNAEIIIMDEPTDALTDVETENLYKVINDLKKEGKALIYISHKLSEIFDVCDRATILRDGTFVDEQPVSALTEEKIIQLMVGRPLSDRYPRCDCKAGEVVFQAEGLTNHRITDVSFSVRSGEIVGIAGLMGSGRSEVAKSIFGEMPISKGSVTLAGKKLKINHPSEAIRNGISYVSEDRKQLGLIIGMTIKENITLPALKKFQTFLSKVSFSKEDEVSAEYIEKMSIKTTGPSQRVVDLSGGNQQKVAIAKGLVTAPKVLILDEPTRGVDVGAKKEIYDQINILKSNGMSIILISSEMPEVIGMSDRILVMSNGRIAGEVSGEEATQENIMRLAMSYIKNAI